MAGSRHYKRLRWLYLTLAVLELLVIELPGVRDYRLAPYAGYELGAESSNDFNSDYLIPFLIERVRPGSPAERAGFRPGDRTLSVAGIPFVDQRRIIELGRPKIGETRQIGVQRGEERLLLYVSYEKNPASYDLKYSAFAVIALTFLVTGTVCFWFYPGPTTSLLFWLGLSGAFVFMHKPYLNSFPLRSAFAMLRWFITSLWLALLLHFLLIFPKPKRIFSVSRLARFALYLPCLLLFLIIAYFTAFPSHLTAGGEFVLNSAFFFIAAYLVLGVVAIIHTYLTLLKSERTRGMKLMAIGTAIGMLPIAVSIITLILAPRIQLPLRDYYILTLVLIPVCFAIGVWERMSSRPATP